MKEKQQRFNDLDSGDSEDDNDVFFDDSSEENNSSDGFLSDVDVVEDEEDDFLGGIDIDEDEEDKTGVDEEDDFLTGIGDGFLDDSSDTSATPSQETSEQKQVSAPEVEVDTDVPVSRNESIRYSPVVYYHSSERMPEIGDESVELAVTSPPYNADWAYGSHDDAKDYTDEYLPMLASIFTECYRVLRPGGRLVVNVPSLLRGGTEGGRPIASDIAVMMNSAKSAFQFRVPEEQQEIAKLRANTEWKIREQIVWNKGFNDAGLAPNGSFPRPWGVLFNNMHEVLVVFQKPGGRDYDKMADERIEASKIDKWTDDLLDDVWDISPEDWNPRWVEEEDVPPFPEELVRRCVALYTYKDDTVLDPFTGRGTTLKVAKEMERHSIGYEIREELKDEIEHYAGLDQAGLDAW